jgi:hypothetical protein
MSYRQNQMGGLRLRVSELLKVFITDRIISIGASQLFPRWIPNMPTAFL